MQIHTRGFFPVQFRGIISLVISSKITILTYYPDYTWIRHEASLAVKCESLLNACEVSESVKFRPFLPFQAQAVQPLTHNFYIDFD